MRNLLAVLAKDLLRKVRSPLGPAIYLVFPVLFALLIGLTFGRTGENIAPIRIALVDEDGGFAARLIRSTFSQNQGPQRFDVRVADMPAAMRLIEDDKVSALLRIPAGFSDSLFSGRSTRLEVVKNPAESVYPQVAEEYAKVLALVGGSAVRALSGPLQEIREASKRKAAPPDAFISDVSVAIRHKMDGVGRYALPPAIRLEKLEAPGAQKEKEASPFRVALFVLPGMSIFALMMLALGSMADFPRERAHGTLARQLVAPVPAWTVVVGKVAATWVLAIVCIVVLALVAAIWARAGVSAAGFIGLSLAFALAATGFAALVQSVSRSERGGTAVGSILVMLMTMAGGSWVPLESLPAVVRRIAPAMPTYWAAQGYRDLVFESASAVRLLPNILVLLVLGAVLLAGSVLFFRRRYRAGG